MNPANEKLLFDDETGCLTGFALQSLTDGTLGELERLEVSEHLSYCDLCVERYAALLADDTLMEAPELLKQGVLAQLRRRLSKILLDRYFHMGVAACLTLVLWSTGVFTSFGELAMSPPRLERPAPDPDRVSISRRLDDFAAGIGDNLDSLLERLTTIDLRGALSHEKE